MSLKNRVNIPKKINDSRLKSRIDQCLSKNNTHIHKNTSATPPAGFILFFISVLCPLWRIANQV